MRGRLVQLTLGVGDFGTTPAYAGKTVLLVLVVGRLRDHPRVCGEDDLGTTSNLLIQGPPPRMRGRHSLTWSNVAPLVILDTTASAAWQGQKRA